VHALLFSVTQRTQLIPLSLSPNSDESGKQSLYPDGDPDRHQNLTRMWANAQRDGRLPNIGGALCSMPQSLADAHD